MRKDADYKVDNKVTMIYETQNENLNNIIQDFSDFLKWEALLKEIKKESNNPKWDISAIFNIDELTVNFTLIK